MPGAGRIVVSRQGAQLLSWRTADGLERLYLSPLAAFDGHTALRGGVPVCFPQFGRCGPLAPHGFARNLPWATAPATADTLTFRLHDTATTRASWPFAFDATLTLRLEPNALQLTLSVHNPGPEAFTFTAALHSYLHIDGLDGARLDGFSPPLSFTTGIDHIVAAAPPRVELVHRGGRLQVGQGGGFQDTVVWNPGATPMADLPPADAARFVCVEAACVDTPVRLGPAHVWSGWQSLTVVG